jgi:hypothetical protein
MESHQPALQTVANSDARILLVGLLAVGVGLTLPGFPGITSLLLAFGIGLVVGGTVYLAAIGSERYRLSLAFLALVAVPLLGFGGTMQWVAILMIGAVICGALSSRV